MNGLPVSELAMMMAALIGAGAIAGLIGGLFGVGGGTVLVPALFYAFSVLGVGGESNLHVAIGTSLLTIVATSLRSLSTHRKHGAVDEVVLKTWTPWVAFGALVGAFIAGGSPMSALSIVYGVCLVGIAAQMGLLPATFVLRQDLPTGWGRRLTASVIGTLSAMMGIGGGSFGGMVMTLCNRPIHQAVATSSGFGLAIGAVASLGYIVFGLGKTGVPPLTLGFVNIPAAIIMGLLTAWTAPYGARLAHRLDRRMLRRAFAIYLLVTAILVVVKALA
ncbi:sulfite exporter TauE/SafE family protein [Brevundimonas sp. BH3]|uniref:sulfite exporter TauE/SafE family protein n=1 Tax=unclassified Brevundimonas TaxID=2622653 RepID=UPI002896388B|nr:sulfite exporter TauE/SafE family protein [Brevundimonas sp.]